MRKFMFTVSLLAVVCGVIPVMGMELESGVIIPETYDKGNPAIAQLEHALEKFHSIKKKIEENDSSVIETNSLVNQGYAAFKITQALVVGLTNRVKELNKLQDKTFKHNSSLSAEVEELIKKNASLVEEESRLHQKIISNNEIYKKCKEKLLGQLDTARFNDEIQEKKILELMAENVLLKFPKDTAGNLQEPQEKKIASLSAQLKDEQEKYLTMERRCDRICGYYTSVMRQRNIMGLVFVASVLGFLTYFLRVKYASIYIAQ